MTRWTWQITSAILFVSRWRHIFFFPRAHKSIAVAAFFIAHRPNFIEKTASGMGSRRIATGHGAFVGSRRVELTKNGQCVFLFIVPSRSRCTYCCFFFLLWFLLLCFPLFRCDPVDNCHIFICRLFGPSVLICSVIFYFTSPLCALLPLSNSFSLSCYLG